MRILVLASALSLASPAFASFDPVEFFRGHSEGEGKLKIIFEKPRRVDVKSEGRVEKDGSLTLSQRVHQEGQVPRIRHWKLRRSGPTRFTGTLTDAAGPVTVDLVGARARIRYTMKNHMTVEQWLSRSGERTVSNQMKVRRFGLVVARFTETIRKLD
ncbi:MAG: DUF3833 family protein [Sphingomonas sp.]|nr:DUF3833 family protein [Sphingomonas sp.]